MARAVDGRQRRHLERGDEQRGLPLVTDAREAEFDARRAAPGAAHLRLEHQRRAEAVAVAAHVLLDEPRKIGVDEFVQRAADQLARRGGAAQLGEPRIGHLHAVALDGHGLVHRLGQTAIDELALGARRGLALQPREQLVGLLRKLGGAPLARVRRETLRQVAGLGDRGEPFAQVAHTAHFTGAARKQHPEQQGEERQRCQCDDHQVVSRACHVPMPRGVRRRRFPSSSASFGCVDGA